MFNMRKIALLVSVYQSSAEYVLHGKYGKAYHINDFFALYGVSQAESFSYEDNHITAKTGNGSEYSLDLDTFIVTGV